MVHRKTVCLKTISNGGVAEKMNTTFVSNLSRRRTHEFGFNEGNLGEATSWTVIQCERRLRTVMTGWMDHDSKRTTI